MQFHFTKHSSGIMRQHPLNKFIQTSEILCLVKSMHGCHSFWVVTVYPSDCVRNILIGFWMYLTSITMTCLQLTSNWAMVVLSPKWQVNIGVKYAEVFWGCLTVFRVEYLQLILFTLDNWDIFLTIVSS